MVQNEETILVLTSREEDSGWRDSDMFGKFVDMFDLPVEELSQQFSELYNKLLYIFREERDSDDIFSLEEIEVEVILTGEGKIGIVGVGGIKGGINGGLKLVFKKK